MAFTKMERNRAFLVISVLYGIWFTIWEWWRLLAPSVQFSVSDKPSTIYMNLLQTLSCVFILFGSLIFGHLVDAWGMRFSALLSISLTGLLYVAHGQVQSYNGFLFIMPLFIAHQLPAICESFVATISDDAQRMTSAMRLRIPLGIAAVAGPCAGVMVSRWIMETSDSQSIAGAVLLVLSLPIAFFFLPEPTPASTASGQLVQPIVSSRKLSEYLQLLGDGCVLKTLFVQFILDGPYQYYDYLRRQYIVGQYLSEPSRLIYLLTVVGAVTLLANTFLISWAQLLLPNRKQRLQVSLIVGAIAHAIIGYFYSSFYAVLIAMPLQMAAASIVYADLLTQLTLCVAAIDKRQFNKVISLARFTAFLAAAIVPLIAIAVTKQFHFDWWSYVASGASLIAAITVQMMGGYMNVSHSKLPSYYIAY